MSAGCQPTISAWEAIAALLTGIAAASGTTTELRSLEMLPEPYEELGEAEQPRPNTTIEVKKMQM